LKINVGNPDTSLPPHSTGRRARDSDEQTFKEGWRCLLVLAEDCIDVRSRALCRTRTTSIPPSMDS